MTSLGPFPGTDATSAPGGDTSEQATAKGGSKAGATRAIGATELADLLAETLGVLSLFIAWRVALPPLRLEPGEASAIADPAARLIVRSAWWKAIMRRWGKAARDVPDTWALLLALLAYGLRVATELQAVPQPAATIQTSRVGGIGDAHAGLQPIPSTPAGQAGGTSDPNAQPASASVGVAEYLLNGHGYDGIPAQQLPIS